MTYRTRRLSRLIIPVSVAVALAGAAGAALAANVSTPPTNAGQGVGVVDGFEIADIAFSTTTTSGSDTEAAVDEVTFTISRDEQATAVDDSNAEVWIQLRTGDTNSVWVGCDVDDGAAECDTSASNVTMADLAEISVIAYDS